MKLVIDDLASTFQSCKAQGYIKEKHTDIELIRSLKLMSDRGLAFIDARSKDI